MKQELSGSVIIFLVEQAHFCDTSDKNKVNWVNPALTSLSLELLLALI